VVFKNERSISASQLARSEGLLLRNYVERFNGLSLAVIGDFALDVYSYGTVARMSREAPVPVLIRDRNMPDDAVLGQAGNCALNIATLGATVFPIGVIGNDQTGSTIIDLLQQKGTSTEGLQVIDHFITPGKERIFAHNLNAPNQQIARIDDDQGAAKLTQLQQQQIIDSIDNILAKCDGVIFSDYGYGVCTSEIVNYVIQKCKQHNIIVLADSRYHIDLYRNVKAIMPSEAEVAPFLNQNITDDNIQQVVLSLRETLNVDHAVITRGSKGMMLTDGQGIYCFPGKSDVVDATGAGDTALALFALTLLSGASAYEAAKLSTAGVAISLMRKGTCVISRQELLAHLQVGLI
jgi:rfaE bifunctional protein kinase chain/domain